MPSLQVYKGSPPTAIDCKVSGSVVTNPGGGGTVSYGSTAAVTDGTLTTGQSVTAFGTLFVSVSVTMIIVIVQLHPQDFDTRISLLEQGGGGGGVPTTRVVAAGTGLTGGGDLSADRTLAADFGIVSGKVTQGNDARLSDARTPTAHAATHATGNSDPITPAAIGAAVASPPALTVTGLQSMPGEASPGMMAKIACAGVVVDSAGWWNVTNKRYVPQVAGRYRASADFSGTAVGVAGGFWDLAVSRNGTFLSAPDTNGSYMNRQPSSSVFGPDMQASGEFIMNGSTDYIELYGGASSGISVSGKQALNITFVGPN